MNHDVSKPLLVTDSVSLMIQPHQTSRATLNQKLNPADIASRGIDVSDTESLSIWLNGPEFIWHGSEHWPKHNLLCEIPEGDVEVKKEIVINTTFSFFIDSFADHFSDWIQLKRATAWLTRFKKYCKHRYLRHHELCRRGNLTLTEIQISENAILVCVQESSFMNEMTSLKKRESCEERQPYCVA